MVGAVLLLVAGFGFLLLGSGKLRLSKDPGSNEKLKKWRYFYLGGGVFLVLAGVVVGLIQLIAK